MALIKCPECGKEVSDKALSCPHCGNPLQSTPPAINLNAPVQATPSAPLPPAGYGAISSAPKVGIDTQKLKCPYCGGTLGPTDILSSGWAKCPTCGETIKLTGANGEFDDNVLIERILPFSMTKDQAHKLFMSTIMNNAGDNVFEKMRVVSLKRLYVWVREFGRANDRVIYPLCQFGKDFFKKMDKGKPWLEMKEYESLFPTDMMVPFNSDDLRDTEMLAKEMSAAEVKLEFSHTDIGNLDPTPNYYCLPLIEEIVEYEGMKYSFYCTGGSHCWMTKDMTMSPLPEPKYTKMKPVTIALWTIIGIVFLIIVIALFKKSFWTAVIVLGILAVAGVLLQGLFVALYWAISAIPMGIDKLICKAVNSRRRKKIRQEYTNLQEAKRQSAKKYLNVDLDYTVPEFPIP